MKKNFKITFLLFIGIFILEASFVYAEHFIVGIVNDAADSTAANGHTVIIYYENDEVNNVSDIIGEGFNAENEYFLDAEEIPGHTFVVGDEIFAKVFDNGDGYTAGPVSVVTTGAGFDEEPDMTLTAANAEPTVDSIFLEDDDETIANELDLNPGTTKLINCSGTVSDADGNSDIDNVTAVLYDNKTSSPDAADNDNNHYTNSSCDTTVLDADTLNYDCLFGVQFHANPALWNCNVTVNDTTGAKDTKVDSSTITELMAIDVADGDIDFGDIKVGADTGTIDQIKTITNNGNVAFDLNLEVLGSIYNYNLSMNCTVSSINASYERWSLTANTDWTLKNKAVSNGTGEDITNFNLLKGASSTKDTYWGMGIALTPIVSGNCSGTVIFTAISDS
ncbi:hypothetical protein JYT91_00855 [archaeon AH-315-M20]|nr:hypothetical protein [archaeon AH-315-M20]